MDANSSENTDNITFLDDDLPWEERDDWDDIDLYLEPEPELTDWDDLFVYTLGTVTAAFIVFRGALVLNYPFSLMPTRMASLSNEDSITLLAIAIIVLFASLLYHHAKSTGSVSYIDGLGSPAFALGLYLLPYVATYPPYLLVTIAFGLAPVAWRRFRHGIHSVPLDTIWDIVSGIALSSLVFMYVANAGFLPFSASQPEHVKKYEGEELQLVSELMSTRSLHTMGHQEIADSMQAIAHLEAKHLDLLDHEPRVLVGLTGTAYSNYNPLTNTITINAIMLSTPGGYSGFSAVNSIAHEMAHAYQYAVTNGIIKGKRNSPLGTLTPEITAVWRREFDRGVDANRHYDEYASRSIEEYAREYAHNETVALFAVTNDLDS